MTQNKTDKKQDIKTETPADNRAAVKPHIVLDDREFLYLAVARPSKLFPHVFVLMCKKDDLLKPYTEQRTFKNHTDAINHENAVRGMVAANHAMYPVPMGLLEDAIKRFNDAMKNIADETGFWKISHTK